MQPLIAIGIPTRDSIGIDTVVSLINILASSRHATQVIFQKGCYIHENRKTLVYEAKKHRATHLFFMDSDMVIPGDILNRLMFLDKDVVGAAYNQRGIPLRSTVTMAEGSPLMEPSELGKDPFKCFSVGTGAMLINISVFSRIEKPWFFFEPHDDGDMGEDVWFCRQVKRAGMEVWCDPLPDIKHIGDYPY